MTEITLQKESAEEIFNLIEEEIRTAAGKKALEFSSCTYSLAKQLRSELDYLACTDKTEPLPEFLLTLAKTDSIQLIPDSELGEDCYFGRFHLVYTLFGFRNLPHLVDEVMRLRRLILKGGKMVIVDFEKEGFSAECTKQLKRCGFTKISQKSFTRNGEEIFLISAEK